MRFKLGILGAGVMGTAILKNIDLKDCAIFDISPEKAQMLLLKGATFVPSMQELVSSSDNVFLSIKPQSATEVFESCDFSLVKNIISIMAGTKIDSIRKRINNKNVGIVRVMPNLAAMVLKGVSALCFDGVGSEFEDEITKMFQRSGSTFVIDEKMFDTITSVSGSGPAYVYLFLDAMVKGGIDGGLSYDDAKNLAVETLIGAATYAKSETVPLETMVERVCSKGGTTIEAIAYFREKDIVGTVREGMKRCKDKSVALSELSR